jgi:hypothetical protein
MELKTKFKGEEITVNGTPGEVRAFLGELNMYETKELLRTVHSPLVQSGINDLVKHKTSLKRSKTFRDVRLLASKYQKKGMSYKKALKKAWKSFKKK